MIPKYARRTGAATPKQEIKSDDDPRVNVAIKVNADATSEGEETKEETE